MECVDRRRWDKLWFIRWTTVCLTFDGRRCCHTLRLKLHRFDLSLYLLPSCLYYISTTNRLSGVWALSFKYVVIFNFSWPAYSNLLSTDARYLVIILERAIWLIFTARCYVKRGICSRRVSDGLSVCVSVILRYCIKTAKRKITHIMPHDWSGTIKWDVL